MVVNIGEKILELIDINTKIWHKATRLKDINNVRRTDIKITPKERVEHFFEVRKLNTKRSSVRWEIDSSLGSGGANESKINFYQGEE